MADPVVNDCCMYQFWPSYKPINHEISENGPRVIYYYPDRPVHPFNRVRAYRKRASKIAGAAYTHKKRINRDELLFKISSRLVRGGFGACCGSGRGRYVIKTECKTL